ncbi:MAG: 3'(2'),5'-bisphosphate nucleotidase CysQ [Alphaproteobacteria bacterium]
MRDLLEQLCRLALDAGEITLRHFGAGAEVRRKENASPVTDADEESEALILEGLARVLPGVPVIAEEAVAAGRVPGTGDRFVLVDPLDGTREFVDERPDFTVNIGLIEAGVPVAGVVYAPARRALYFGAAQTGAFFSECEARAAAFDPQRARAIAVRRPPPEGLVAVASRSHRRAETDAFLKTLRLSGTTSIGSSLKFCLLAAGEADIYPRHGPTMEWDTAAGDAVLRAAGGSVRLLDGTLLTYGKSGEGYRNPPFIARGRANGTQPAGPPAS